MSLPFLQSAVQGNAEALATVTGIVDGTGSVGAAIGQVGQQFLCWSTCIRLTRLHVVTSYRPTGANRCRGTLMGACFANFSNDSQQKF